MSISEDLWRQLDQRAGLLTARQNWSRWIAAGVVVAVGVAVWFSGALAPRVSWELDSFLSSGQLGPAGLMATQDVTITNDGFVPFAITAVSVDIPGLRLVSVRDTKLPVSLGRGRDVSLRLEFAVTDCAAVPLEPRPVRISYSSWTRSGTFDVVELKRKVSGDDEKRRLVAWQRSMADQACDGSYLGDLF